MALVHVPSLEKFVEPLAQCWYQSRNKQLPDLKSLNLYIEFAQRLDAQRANYQLKDTATGMTIGLYVNGGACFKIFRANVAPFTNNCGAKAISGLYISLLSELEEDFRKELGAHLLFCMEAWLRQLWCVSMLVGSDYVYTHGGLTQVGQCLGAVETYGEGYNRGDLIHNQNYPQDPQHKICVYWKDLTPKTVEYGTEYSQWRDA